MHGEAAGWRTLQPAASPWGSRSGRARPRGWHPLTLRPIAFQNAPQWALPAELRDGVTDIPRRIDGRLLPG